MSCLLQVAIHILYMYDTQIILRAILYVYNGKSKQIKVISNTYRVRSDLYRYISDSRYRSHQIHIPGSYRFRTFSKTNRFLGLYQNHIQTYTYSCQGIGFVSFTCFMTFSGFKSCSCSCHLHNSVYLYLMTFNIILTPPRRSIEPIQSYP